MAFMRRCILGATVGLCLLGFCGQASALAWVGNTKMWLNGWSLPTRAAFVEKWDTLTVTTETWPIEPGQRVVAVVTTNNWVTQTEYELNWDYNANNNSHWYRILGPFAPGSEVDFYIRAEGPGGPRYDNNGSQNFGYVQRFTPSYRDGAILQWFQTDYKTIMRRLPEVVRAGYSAIYLPAPQKSGGGGFSTGYNPFDQFDLGDRLQKGTVRTQYGTTQELFELMRVAKRFGIEVYCDLVTNHADNRASTAINQYPNLIPEDFHIRSSADTGNAEINFNVESSFSFGMLNHDLVGLADFAHEDNNNTRTGTFTLPSYASFNAWGKPSFIRNPLTPQYYLNQTPVAEDVRQYLKRWGWWLTNVIGFDGFRIDAVKHTPPQFFDRLAGQPGSVSSQGDFLPSLYATKPNLFVMGEDYTSENYELREFAKTGMNLLDFPLKFNLNALFNSQGYGDLGQTLANGYGLDSGTGLPYMNGGLGNTVGVSFVQSHDDGPPQSNNMAHAFILTRPGRSKVYYDGNNIEPNNWSNFPKPGRFDALGQGSDLLLRQLDAKNRFARGSLVNRWVTKNLYVYERQVNGAGTLLVGLNNRGDYTALSATVLTAFQPGTVLEDLSGQAADVTVAANGSVGITVPSNSEGSNSNNARGYVLYAPKTPKALSGFEPVQLFDATQPGTPGFGGALPFTANPLPGGTYASGGSFRSATLTSNLMSIRVRTDAIGATAFAKLDDAVAMAGRTIGSGTPEGLTDGYVALDKSADGDFRLTGVDLASLADGLHVLRVRVFLNAGNRPGLFSEFPVFFYLSRGLGRSIVVDGDLTDLGAPLTSQSRNPSSSFNRVDALYARNDDLYLYVGLAGRVDPNESLTNGMGLLLDLDPGAATGVRDLSTVNDDSGPAARLLSNTKITLPSSFGAEMGVGIFRGVGLHSSPEAPYTGGAIAPWPVGSASGTFRIPTSGPLTVLSGVPSAIAYQLRVSRSDPPKGVEIAIPLREIYTGSVPANPRIGFIGGLWTTGESGGTLLASDPNRATLGGRPAPAAWVSNQFVPSQANVVADVGTGPITLLQSTNYNVALAQTPFNVALQVRTAPAPSGTTQVGHAVRITNTGAQSIDGPIYLLASNVPGGATLTGSHGSMLQPGSRYIRVTTGSLAPGASVVATMIYSGTTPSAIAGVSYTVRNGSGIL